ncbi:putative F-box/LRR-repeat protein 8 [Euphorbia lathyris]|uniref:putative F-box/LRR-repeat protein 8 n=1 Tax=Euphorbia lathyris TaxID=212925 RepID=UPI003313CEDF
MGQASSITITEDLTLSLPDECLATIFSKLSSTNDKNSCSLVCKRWKFIDSKSRDRLVLFSPSHISSSFTSLLSRFTYISILSLKCSRKHLSIDDNSFSKIPNLLLSLTKLKLKGCVDISDNGLIAFSSHNSPLPLIKASFTSCGFGAKGLISLLSNSPYLLHLTLKRLRNLDAHNTPLSHHVNLKRLCLKDIHNARIFIPLIKSLKTLIVCRSSGNWDKVLQSSLIGVNNNTSKTSISEIQMENVQMGDSGLIAISSSCPDLQVLHLSRTTDCTDEGISAVASSCSDLRKLHIDAWRSRFGGRTIGDGGVLSVAKKCSNLQELVLMGIQVTGSSLSILASKCRNLERLAICNTETIGDMEMRLIGEKFRGLKKLCIKNCPITEKGIEAIADGCPNLVKLKVKRCRGITELSVRNVRIKRSLVVISVDSVINNGEQEQETTSNTSTTTHDVVCTSNTAVFLRSAFQIGRRTN